MTTMSLDRREFLARTAGGFLAASMPTGGPRNTRLRRTHIKAIAFDAFPIFDPRPIDALAEELRPGRGAELMATWRRRQFEYTWLRTLSNQYLDFWRTTEAALAFAAASLKLDLDSVARERLMGAYLRLPAWPDVRPALESLRAAGIRMACLSNFTSRMLDACVATAGLGDFFGEHLSTDRVQAFKPDPRAYAMALRAFGLPREAIGFAAFAGWDAAGAKWFGFPTIWVNRAAATREQLGVMPDLEVGGLQDLASAVAV
jgi:2-haloacid dehalogenase